MERVTHTERKGIRRRETDCRNGESDIKGLSIQTPVVNQGPKPIRAKKQWTNVAAEEIKYYQANSGFLLPKACLIRLVRMIAKKISKPGAGFRFTSESFNLIQEALENYIVCAFRLGHLASTHAKRVTVHPVDLALINRIISIYIQ